jgi:hypothetical protein
MTEEELAHLIAEGEGYFASPLRIGQLADDYRMIEDNTPDMLWPRDKAMAREWHAKRRSLAGLVDDLR